MYRAFFFPLVLLGPGNAVNLFLVLQNVMNIFASVASYEYLIR